MINQQHIDNIEEISNNYKLGTPYPHIVLDNFLQETYASYIAEEVKKYNSWILSEDSEFENSKFFAPSNDENSIRNLNLKCPITFSVIEYFKSQFVLNYLTKLTGIETLLADPGFTGSGLHKTCNGGRLGLHVDFNQNWNTGLHRRINFLLYLNKDWKEEYNGHLELWNNSPWKCEQKISPIFNRLVVFSTTRKTYHGHPVRLSCPDSVARYSIASYYYTEEPNEEDDAEFRKLEFVNDDHVFLYKNL